MLVLQRVRVQKKYFSYLFQSVRYLNPLIELILLSLGSRIQDDISLQSSRKSLQLEIIGDRMIASFAGHTVSRPFYLTWRKQIRIFSPI